MCLDWVWSVNNIHSDYQSHISFSVCAPCLPQLLKIVLDLQNLVSLPLFQSRLKTHLLQIAYPT